MHTPSACPSARVPEETPPWSRTPCRRCPRPFVLALGSSPRKPWRLAAWLAPDACPGFPVRTAARRLQTSPRTGFVDRPVWPPSTLAPPLGGFTAACRAAHLLRRQGLCLTGAPREEGHLPPHREALCTSRVECRGFGTAGGPSRAGLLGVQQLRPPSTRESVPPTRCLPSEDADLGSARGLGGSRFFCCSERGQRRAWRASVAVPRALVRRPGGDRKGHEGTWEGSEDQASPQSVCRCPDGHTPHDARPEKGGLSPNTPTPAEA